MVRGQQKQDHLPVKSRIKYFNESNAMLAEKVNICFDNSLTSIFCCGEPLSIREAGTQNSLVETQLKESLFHLTFFEISHFHKIVQLLHT